MPNNKSERTIFMRTIIVERVPGEYSSMSLFPIAAVIVNILLAHGKFRANGSIVMHIDKVVEVFVKYSFPFHHFLFEDKKILS
jgi:hypothetical protein